MSESGRFNPKLKNQKIHMALFSNGKGKKIVGQSLVAYRLQNQKAIDPKTTSDVS